MIPVTKPFLPPKSEYYGYLDAMYERNWLTNNGPYVRELEENLSEYLGVEYLRFVSNGTIALQIAIKALELKGEIITTPFSYVATTSSIVWEGCTPVFVDIDQESLCIDPIKIEVAITSKTSAILATHIFGNPCDVEAIQAIADKYGLKVIYDAAHAFGVKYKGESIFNYGDISITSFHATKLFHTSSKNNFKYELGNSIRENVHSNFNTTAWLQAINYSISPHQHISIQSWWQDTFREIPPTTTQNISEAVQIDRVLRLFAEYKLNKSMSTFSSKLAYFDEDNDFEDPQILIASENRFKRILSKSSLSMALNNDIIFKGIIELSHARGQSQSYEQTETLSSLSTTYGIKVIWHSASDMRGTL